MGESILELDAVSYAYTLPGSRERATILRDVRLNVPYGASVAIRGESGSGKSTLLNLLGGLDRASSGHVIVDGSDLQTMNDADLARFRARRVGFVFQEFNLLPDLSALDNVALPMDAFPTLAAGERRVRARQLLEAVGLSHRMEHDPQHLSGGERQRVAIARALANRPTLLLADEPTGNLSGRVAVRVLELLRGLNESHRSTLVVVTHDRHVAEHCERIYRLKDGVLHRRYSEEIEAARHRQPISALNGLSPADPQPV